MEEMNTGITHAAEESSVTAKGDRITEILNMIIQVCAGKKTAAEALKVLALEHKDEVIFWTKDKACAFLDARLKSAKRQEIRALTEAEFSSRLVDSMDGIRSVVISYYRREISREEMMETLANTGIKEVAIEALDAMGIPESLGFKDMDALLKMASGMTAYTVLASAYPEIRKALEDKRIAHERRVELEAESARVVELITTYRKDMEQVVSEYFSKYYSTFESGFDAMDKAVLENDIDGYIKGNAEIQKALGYKAQFTSQEEFDDLMLSDETFRL